MFVIEPITFDDFYYTNLAANDHPVWDSGATYSLGARVSYGRINYQSVQGSNTNNAPPPWDGGDLSWWVPISYINRWRAFDRSLGEATTNADSIQYSITLPLTINAVALFGISADNMVVQVLDSDGAVIFSRIIQLTTSEEVYDAWTYFFNEIDYLEQIVVTALPAFSGSRLVLNINAPGGTARVSEIFIGTSTRVGVTTVGTQIGIRDYSIKERDEFGNQRVVERGYTSVTTFNFAFPTEEATRIKKLMARLRNKAAVYFSEETDPDLHGTLTPGFYKDFNIPLTTVESYGVLEVESLL